MKLFLSNNKRVEVMIIAETNIQRRVFRNLYRPDSKNSSFLILREKR